MTYTLKIKIDGSSKPPIWRQIQVSENLSFDELHLIIQVVFGWNNSHMYEFSPDGWRSSPKIKYRYEDDFIDNIEFSEYDLFPHGGEYFDSSLIKLIDYFQTTGQKLTYIYDFGDNWVHSIILRGISNESILRPSCIQGKGKAPVDDCGGIGGYYYMVECINDSEDPEHQSWREWLGIEEGEIWDEHEFDLEGTNDFLWKVWDKWMEKKRQNKKLKL